MFGRKFRNALMPVDWRGNNFHLLPVIREFFAAIEASYVRSRQSGGLRTARCSANRDWKTVTGVPAAKNQIN
jgi:hypothetical protein